VVIDSPKPGYKVLPTTWNLSKIANWTFTDLLAIKTEKVLGKVVQLSKIANWTFTDLLAIKTEKVLGKVVQFPTIKSCTFIPRFLSLCKLIKI
jgi:hypothetical protein